MRRGLSGLILLLILITSCSFPFNPRYESDEGKECVKKCRTEQQDCLDGQWYDSYSSEFVAECLESCEEQERRVKGIQASKSTVRGGGNGAQRLTKMLFFLVLLVTLFSNQVISGR
ncbi:MAG: hypothetical protein OEV18_18170 [Deltaproteobacteria bacterium]|nr:hypothetical protein [Deltaproteobacteria bacterium]MDH3899312.1 hypothetical protein [Deltaproteobacteria bacterium]